MKIFLVGNIERKIFPKKPVNTFNNKIPREMNFILQEKKIILKIMHLKFVLQQISMNPNGPVDKTNSTGECHSGGIHFPLIAN